MTTYTIKLSRDAIMANEFANIPEETTKLNLQNNNLGGIPNETLLEGFAAIPRARTINELDLSQNSFFIKTGVELAQVLNAIYENITFLDLYGNRLGYKTGAELEQAFESIPLSVTSLSLAFNDLHRMSINDLKQALSAIPLSVTSLNLAFNHFHRMPTNDLEQVLSAIPDRITCLGLIDRFTPDQLRVISESIQSHPNITSVEYMRNEQLQDIQPAIEQNRDKIKAARINGFTMARTPLSENTNNLAAFLPLRIQERFKAGATQCIREQLNYTSNSNSKENDSPKP